LTEGLEIDADNLIGKEPDETVWATIDTESDPWVIIDVEIEKDA
jgi:hypothetical protein